MDIPQRVLQFNNDLWKIDCTIFGRISLVTFGPKTHGMRAVTRCWATPATGSAARRRDGSWGLSFLRWNCKRCKRLFLVCPFGSHFNYFHSAAEIERFKLWSCQEKDWAFESHISEEVSDVGWICWCLGHGANSMCQEAVDAEQHLAQLRREAQLRQARCEGQPGCQDLGRWTGNFRVVSFQNITVLIHNVATRHWRRYLHSIDLF